MKQFLLLFMSVFYAIYINAQAPTIQWQKAIGGTADDMVVTMKQTSDEGFIVAGVTASKDGDVVNAKGKGDIFVTKLDKRGVISWKKALGGPGEEQGANIQQTPDGGYLVIGNTSSSSGDVKGFHGGSSDIWVVKLSASGTIQWQNCLGGNHTDEYVSLKILNDGYLVYGNTLSNDGDVTGNHGDYDIWVAKLNTSGAIAWQKCFGSSGTEKIRDLEVLPNGDYVFAGCTNLGVDGDVQNYHGNFDIWLARMNSNGQLIWNSAFGGSGYENHFNIFLTVSTEGGYVALANTGSTDGDVEGISDGYACFLMKFDANNQLLWKKVFSKGNEPYAIVRTSDNAFAFVTAGQDDDPNTTGGVLVVKVSDAGDVQWQKETGGSVQDYANLMEADLSGGVTIMGTTNSSDIPGYHKGLDTWLIHLDATGNMVWQNAYGGSNNDFLQGGTAVASGTTFPISTGTNMHWSTINPSIHAVDGGYYFAVSTGSSDGDVTGFHYNKRVGYKFDFWVVKLSASQTPTTQNTIEIQEVNKHFLQPVIYPNPAGDHTNLMFKSLIKGKVVFELYTASGARVKQQYFDVFDKGLQYHTMIQLKALPPGSYIFKLTQGNQQSTGILIKN